MMTAYDFYRFMLLILPLYVSMFIGYGSVKWWKFFNQDQCSGISKFCLLIAVPVLSFHYISKTNLYEMNLKLLGADVLQKVMVLVVLACWYKLGPRGSIELLITIFSICTLPNVLILGVPIIRGMYLTTSTPLVVEIFLTQSVIWHPLLLIMYEYHAANIVISQQVGDTRDRDVDIKTATTGGQGIAGGISSTDTRAKEVEATCIANVGGKGEDLEIHGHAEGHESNRDRPCAENEKREMEEAPSASTTVVIPETEYKRLPNSPTSISFTSVMTKRIIIMVWKKLVRNPNTYATIVGLVWAFVLSKFHTPMPQIVARSVTFLSNASLGMGMFNMGLSMGLQTTLIPCGKVAATLTMVLRFVIGPLVMAFASLIVGLRGTILRVSVVQAAVSQGVTPSIFAVQYNVYPKVFNIGMIFGMVVALPVTLLYYNLFEIQK